MRESKEERTGGEKEKEGDAGGITRRQIAGQRGNKGRGNGAEIKEGEGNGDGAGKGEEGSKGRGCLWLVYRNFWDNREGRRRKKNKGGMGEKHKKGGKGEPEGKKKRRQGKKQTRGGRARGGPTGAKECAAYGLFHGDVLGSLGCVQVFVRGGDGAFPWPGVQHRHYHYTQKSFHRSQKITSKCREVGVVGHQNTSKTGFLIQVLSIFTTPLSSGKPENHAAKKGSCCTCKRSLLDCS